MPKYQYFCKKCEKETDRWIEYNKRDEVYCECGEKLERVENYDGLNVLKHSDQLELKRKIDREKDYYFDKKKEIKADIRNEMNRVIDQKLKDEQ